MPPPDGQNRDPCYNLEVASPIQEDTVKGAQKPKKDVKKPAQKTLKERRAEKRDAPKLRPDA